MRDALGIFLDAAQVAKQAFGLAMLAVRPTVPAKTSAPRTVPSKWLSETHRDRRNRLSNVAGPRMENVGFRFPMLRY